MGVSTLKAEAQESPNQLHLSHSITCRGSINNSSRGQGVLQNVYTDIKNGVNRRSPKKVEIGSGIYLNLELNLIGNNVKLSNGTLRKPKLFKSFRISSTKF